MGQPRGSDVQPATGLPTLSRGTLNPAKKRPCEALTLVGSNFPFLLSFSYSLVAGPTVPDRSVEHFYVNRRVQYLHCGRRQPVHGRGPLAVEY
jgi:hypothetical protein